MNGRRAGAVLALLLAATALSGCIGPDDEPLAPANASRTDHLVDGTPGTLVVEVTDPQLRPIEAAEVTLFAARDTRSAFTDPRGVATFESVPGGPSRLTVAAAGHAGRQLDIEVPVDARIVQPVTLLPVGFNRTYVETFEFEGFFECSATAFIITGDCFATARELGRQTGLPLGENATNERFVFPFPVGPHWTRIVITQSWDEPAAGVGTMMRLNLEPAQSADNEMHNERYARAEGSSPVVLELTPGTRHEGASEDGLVMPEDGGVFQTRSFHLGLAETHNAGGTEFLGTGAAFQQHFSVVIDVQYG